MTRLNESFLVSLSMKKVIAIIVFGLLWCNVGFAEIDCDTWKCHPDSVYQSPDSVYQNPDSIYQNPDSIYQNPDSPNYIPSCELTGAC